MFVYVSIAVGAPHVQSHHIPLHLVSQREQCTIAREREREMSEKIIRSASCT